jgi:hypothetical protein
MSWWYNLQINGLKIFIVFTYLFYISAVIGVAVVNPTWYRHLDIFMKLYVGLFLVVRFNPFRTNVQFTELDRQISFNAGVFVLSMLVVNTIFGNYIRDSIETRIIKRHELT